MTLSHLLQTWQGIKSSIYQSSLTQGLHAVSELQHEAPTVRECHRHAVA